MTGLIVALVLCVLLGAAVVYVVAMPARREGRDLLAPKGEEMLESVKSAASSAKEQATGLFTHQGDDPDSDADPEASVDAVSGPAKD